MAVCHGCSRPLEVLRETFCEILDGEEVEHSWNAIIRNAFVFVLCSHLRTDLNDFKSTFQIMSDLRRTCITHPSLIVLHMQLRTRLWYADALSTHGSHGRGPCRDTRNNLQISADACCINQMLVAYHWTAGFPNTQIGHRLACDVAYILRQPHLSLQAIKGTRRIIFPDIAPPLDLQTTQSQVRGRSHCSAGYARHSIFGST